MSCRLNFVLCLCLLCCLVGCDTGRIPTPAPVEENPPGVVIEPLENSHSYINISIDEFEYHPDRNKEVDRFRLFVIVSDDQGHSGGIFCPASEPMHIEPGDVFKPCSMGISIPQDYPEEELYIMMVAVNESSSNEGTEFLGNVVSSSLALALDKAILSGVTKAATATGSPPVILGSLTLDVIIGFAGGKAEDWLTRQEVLGIQSYLITRNMSWMDGQRFSSPSQNGQMQFSFFSEVTRSAYGQDIIISGRSKTDSDLDGGVESEKSVEPTHGKTPESKKKSEPQGTIVFQSTIEGFQQVCIMDADGSNQRQLMKISGAAATYPSLSADGKSVIYTSNLTGDHAIYEISLSNMQTKRLTEDGGDKAYPVLSPSGNSLTYTDVNSSGGNSIFIINRDGSGLREIYSGGTRAEFSRDGNRLAFICGNGANPQICVMNTDGSDVKEISNLTDLNYRVSWSPDGSLLTFSIGKREDKNRKICTMDADGNGLQTIYDDGNAVSPQFSPDGEWIVFANYKVDGREDPGEIYIIRVDGTDLRRLTHNERTDWLPYWGK